ncbi:MAG: hypothetical protein K2I43_01845, partial [Alistipes sp.]|nr:hypothetical protein [Alistipes sp.]
DTNKPREKASLLAFFPRRSIFGEAKVRISERKSKFTCILPSGSIFTIQNSEFRIQNYSASNGASDAVRDIPALTIRKFAFIIA